MRRLIAEQPDPRTSKDWWLWRISFLQALTLVYLVKAVYWPIYLYLGWGVALQ